jgi:tagaturonate reductase
MNALNRDTAGLQSKLPIKVIQFGEGNFLRAFADWMIDLLNEKSHFDSGVAVVQPIERGMVGQLEEQQGLYHLLIRGLADGELVNQTRLISCIQKTVNPFIELQAYFELAENPEINLIISNTTEAGIEFDRNDMPQSGELAGTFPGKLTQLLWKRFQFFKGVSTAGVGIIPCELIDRNGDKLKQAILQYAELWNLSEEFINWVNQSIYFANTLVDRIVPGYPGEEIEQIQRELGYRDQLVVSAEAFHLWIIEGPEQLQQLFPANDIGLNVKFVTDQTPYRTRKVRILNGAHTAMVAVGTLAGLVTVKETIEHPEVGSFIKELIFEEIIPTIDLPIEELQQFANEVIERFMNPFIRHELQSISLNSISKFKVRVLPSLLDYMEQNQTVPKRLCKAFASLIRFYQLGAQGKFPLKDDPKHLAFFSSLGTDITEDLLVSKVLGNQHMWGQDLSQNQSLLKAVTEAL